MPVTVLVLVETINDYLPIIEGNGFHVILAPTPAERAKAIKTHGGQVQAVLTRGPLGLYAVGLDGLGAFGRGGRKNHVKAIAFDDRQVVVDGFNQDQNGDGHR